jgi:hypothetical protein
MTDVGTRLAAAVAAKDADAVRSLLAPAVDFRALTPRTCWEAHTPGEVLEVMFGNWFGDTDRIDTLLAARTGTVGARQSLSYRVAITNPDGRHEVEQQAYFSLDADGRIGYLRILCSGYMAVPATDADPVAEVPTAAT